MTDKFTTTVIVNSGVQQVWRILTDRDSMSQWMGDPEMDIKVQTDWKINSPIFITGFHHVKFQNNGMVLQYDKEKRLKYSHLSSVSRLPDQPENYSVIEFILTPLDQRTQLRLEVQNFPTDTIRKHLEFYWKTTLHLIKTTVEKQVG
jgi:uncharacterized protein YndB with AHSA1/START domain